jgi:hypothetical protein
MIRKVFYIIFIIFSVNSCDILRTSPFEVTSWLPGEGYHSEPDKIIVSLKFSHDPDKDSIERRFSFNDDNGRINGVFSWQGKEMIFTPFLPLEENMDFNISLSAEARNTKGLSMDTAFEHNFSTRPGTERPVMISYSPEMYTEISEPRTEIQLQFNMPLPLKSLYDNVSFSPSMTGFWRLEEEETLAIFTPVDPWLNNRRYEIRISSSLTDNKGMNTGNDFLSIFTTGTDHDKPDLLEARRLSKNGNFVLLQPDTTGFVSATNVLIENHDWEKDDRLFLLFSKPVDSISVKNSINAEGSPVLLMETSPEYETEFVFYFSGTPAYESRFVFRLKQGVKDKTGNESEHEFIYRIFANGKNSKPPVLEGLRMPMAPGSNTDKELVYFGTDSLFNIIHIKDEPDYYPSGQGISTWIELYFSTAENAFVDPISLMELFRIETSNNVFFFSPRQIKTENFTVTNPQEGMEHFNRIEITGILTNSGNFGVITFQIGSGLRDSLGNKSEKAFRISLLK